MGVTMERVSRANKYHYKNCHLMAESLRERSTFEDFNDYGYRFSESGKDLLEEEEAYLRPKIVNQRKNDTKR